MIEIIARSVYNSEAYNALPNWLDPFPNPYTVTGERNGYGTGADMDMLPLLWPSLLFALFFAVVRWLGKQYFFSAFAGLCGIKKERAKRKFAYQLWLAMFYSTSSAVGYYLLSADPWVSFPLGHKEQMLMMINYPQQPMGYQLFYYNYEIGFFIAELFAIFVETRRSDFVEYVTHHVCTIFLLVGSHVSYEHKVGTYVLIIHDLSDIFLCVAKLCHYAKFDLGVTVNFIIFVVGFAFMRLVCLPSMILSILYCAPMIRQGTIPFLLLEIALCLLLQGLHVFWFGLIIRMIVRLATGVKGDVRSDEDEEDSPERNRKYDNSKTKMTDVEYKVVEKKVKKG